MSSSSSTTAAAMATATSGKLDVLKFSQSNHDVFLPHGRATTAATTSSSLQEALARTTHLGIGAHQDDLEFMALAGILECFDDSSSLSNNNDNKKLYFGGITCTDGAGSARGGSRGSSTTEQQPYGQTTDDEMKQIRILEQRKAAMIGNYSCMVQLGHPSRHAKQADQRQKSLVADLKQILQAIPPGAIIYTHNPFDKHATHVGVFLATLQAIRELPVEQRPQQLIGCEVWRGLDWLSDHDAHKLAHNVSARPNLAAALNGVFDSQISGGKRYDAAVEGRRRANATFLDSHATDGATHVQYGVDLTDLVVNPQMSVQEFCRARLQRFQQDVLDQLESLEG
eukprot:scaffold5314_cov167-Amphora_coffeaeformis.AAC.8